MRGYMKYAEIWFKHVGYINSQQIPKSLNIEKDISDPFV